MRKILRALAVCVVAALLILIALSYYEGEKGGDTPATDILQEIIDAGKQAGDSVNDFINESGLKDGAAELLEQGADLLRNSPAPSSKAAPSPNQFNNFNFSRKWV